MTALTIGLAATLLLFPAPDALATRPVAARPADEAANSALSERHRVLLLAARDLAAVVGEHVWPGWKAEMEVLLIAGERETLIGGPRAEARRPAGFEAGVEAPGLGATAVRPRIFPPSTLATMAVFGPPATIVVGAPETTDRSANGWLQVLLHEHFHQWQMRELAYYEATTALDLAGGDTTGRWMLDHPFPYDDEALGQAFASLSRDLAILLRRPAADDLTAEAAALWDRFRGMESSLSTPDARYLNFQLWQEGVARFVELRVAEEAAARWRPPAALTSLADFEEFGTLACAAWEELLAELEGTDLAANRRVSFYAFGAGLALLLDRTEANWKRRYEAPRFALAPLTGSH